MGFDILLIIAGIILLLVAFAGCFLPVLPGPPLAFGALILLHFTTVTDVPSEVLWSMAGLALLVTILDYVVPVWGTRKF